MAGFNVIMILAKGFSTLNQFFFSSAPARFGLTKYACACASLYEPCSTLTLILYLKLIEPNLSRSAAPDAKQ